MPGNVTLELSLRDAQLVAGLLNAARAQDKLTDGVKKTTRASKEMEDGLKRTSRAHEESFGTVALGQVFSYAAGIGTISTALGVLRGQFDKMAESRDKALASLAGVQDQNAKLAQLPGFAENAKARDAIYQKYGLPREEATELIYAARSGNLSDAETAFAARAGQLGPGVGPGMAQFETSMKSAFPGYSARAGGNLALKIAADSPKLEFGDVVTGTPASFTAAGHMGLNLTPEETMAIVEKMSLSAGTPTEALERFELLAGRLSIDKRFKGKGKFGFDEMSAKSDDEAADMLADTSGLSPDDAEKFLGKRKELRQAIRMYRAHEGEIPGYVKELKATAAATGTPYEEVESRARDRFSVPGEAAELERRKSENTATVTREGQLGVQTSQAARMKAASETASRKRGDSQWSTAGAQRGAAAGEYMGGRPIDVAVGAAGGKFIAEGGGLGALAGKYQEGLGTGLLYTNPIGLMIASFERLQKVTEEQKEILNEINASNKDMANQTPRIPAPNPNGGGRR
jgi:hypothetical protein